MELKFNMALLLVTAVYIVTANNPERQYSYKAQIAGKQDVGVYNCVCTELSYLDCLDALRKGQKESGVYLLKPDDMSPFEAYCDMDTDGGGWTVFQRRKDGSVDFYLNWADYVNGFGNIRGEHWLGLSKLHRLANGSPSTQLRVDLRDKTGTKAYAKYSTFYIGGSTTDYILHVSGYSGTAGDSLGYHNNWKFTTKDNDNDARGGENCAVTRIGAWWYNSCSYSNLNGRYDNVGHERGVFWQTFKGWSYSLPFTEMKLRRA